MNSHEFFLWLNGYLEALESEGITECKIENIRSKMGEIKIRNQERVVYGPNVTPQSRYVENPPK
tara:strand:+ start:834 stop:1025 length:192 start_codon:yes stop_codon:yes gene_type:complete